MAVHEKLRGAVLYCLMFFMKTVSAALKVLETQGVKGLGAAIGSRVGIALGTPSRREFIEFGIRPVLLRPRVKHLHGPPKISYGPDELLVISVVRNGELYVRSFMDHYLSMGARHIVFLDNGSTDRTVEMLSGYERVTVLHTDAPYQKYENTMKRYVAERFSQGKWNLCADIDELFDYPYSGSLILPDFIRYLNEHRYTAVIAQMLDMFSDTPLAELETRPNDSLSDKYAYYDISAIKKTPYIWATTGNGKLKMHRGGIRKSVFGTNNGLTKAALVKMDGKVKPFVGWHQARDAWVADVSCVLKHYPFVAGFYTKVQEAVRTGRYGPLTTDEYVAYWKRLERNHNLNLRLETAKKFTGLEELVEEEFLVVSDKYRLWVNAHKLLNS
jgi:hypothetical protein